MRELRACGVSTPVRINEINSAAGFYRLQDKMEEAAQRAGVFRILFDEVWAVRTDGKKGVNRQTARYVS